jgi:hypothetical protein
MLLPAHMVAIVDTHADANNVPRPLARAVIGVLLEEVSEFARDVPARIAQLHNLIDLFGEDRAVAALRWDACFIAAGALWPQHIRDFVQKVNAQADAELAAMGVG